MFKPTEKKSLTRPKPVLPSSLILIFVIALSFSFATLKSGAQSAPSNPSQPTVEETFDPLRNGDFLLNQYKINLGDWPNATFNFTLQNAKEVFRKLKINDVTVTLDDTGVPLKSNDLKLTESEPIGVMVLIDGSLSMLPARSARAQVSGAPSIDKLAAAKEAIKAFLKNLGQHDSAAIYAFDSDLYMVHGPTQNKDELASTVENFQLRTGEDSLHTDLYEALRKALSKTKEYKFKNLIIISDGMQDTDKSEAIRLSEDSQFNSYKRGEEKAISDLASTSGVTIFSIPIGNRNSTPPVPKNLQYVDADTLCNVTSETAGGVCSYVGLPELRAEVPDNSSASLQMALSKRLEKVFENINRTARYGYALTVPLESFPHDDLKHSLRINLKVGKDQVFTVNYPMQWNAQTGLVNVNSATIERKRVFIPVPTIATATVQLESIYFSMLGLMALLAFVPLVIQRTQRASQARQGVKVLKNSIVPLKKGSNLIGYDCPNHKTAYPKPFVEGDVLVICPQCRHPHHLGCWLYNKGKCMHWPCQGELEIPEPVQAQYGFTQS